MNNLGKSLVCGLAALFATTIMAAAPSSISEFVPMTMNYQGYLANPSTGAAYTDGIYDIQCRLYTAASGGTAIWGAQYSVYVKDGYFNIMLGDSTSSTVYSTVSGSSSTTYGKDYLWKALLDTSYNSLYLGVTPLQGPTHAAIQSPSEISPRQQLLTGPYAFRAQSAKYADASLGNFSVGGNLTVTGSVSFPSSYSLGSYLSVSSSTAKFGGTSNSSSNPSTYLYGNYLYGYGYNGMGFTSSAGNITFSTASNKSIKFDTGSFAVTNNTGISLKSRDITLDGSAYYGVTIKGYSPALITTDQDVIITSRFARVQSSSGMYLTTGGNLYINPATNSSINAQGHLYWQPAGFPNSSYSPIKIMNVTVSFPASTLRATYSFSGWNMYRWTIGGYELDGTTTGPGISSCNVYKSGNYWYVEMTRDPNGKNYSTAQTYTVTVVGYLNDITNDAR